MTPPRFRYLLAPLVTALLVLSMGSKAHSQDPFTLPDDKIAPLSAQRVVWLPNNTRVTINGQDWLLPETEVKLERVTMGTVLSGATGIRQPNGKVKFNDDTKITLPHDTYVQISLFPFLAPGAPHPAPMTAVLQDDTTVTVRPALEVNPSKLLTRARSRPCRLQGTPQLSDRLRRRRQAPRSSRSSGTIRTSASDSWIITISTANGRFMGWRPNPRLTQMARPRRKAGPSFARVLHGHQNGRPHRLALAAEPPLGGAIIAGTRRLSVLNPPMSCRRSIQAVQLSIPSSQGIGIGASRNIENRITSNNRHRPRRRLLRAAEDA